MGISLARWLIGEGDDDEDEHISFDDDPFLWTMCLIVVVGLVLLAGEESRNVLHAR
jgi:hypothetical protein